MTFFSPLLCRRPLCLNLQCMECFNKACILDRTFSNFSFLITRPCSPLSPHISRLAEAEVAIQSSKTVVDGEGVEVAFPMTEDKSTTNVGMVTVGAMVPAAPSANLSPHLTHTLRRPRLRLTSSSTTITMAEVLNSNRAGEAGPPWTTVV